MKKVALAAGILFTVLTFVGAGYVIYHQGTVNAGYAVIPMVFALISFTFYRNQKQ